MTSADEPDNEKGQKEATHLVNTSKLWTCYQQTY
jgi:hypothetical protein